MNHQPTIAPGLYILEKQLLTLPERLKCRVYQCLMFVLTFVTYLTYHMNRRPYPIVKNVISANCTKTLITEGNCHTWAPFTGGGDDTYIFGVLDFTFMTTYSVSLFVSGYLAERNELRMFLVFGMIMTSTTTALFGMVRILNVHQLGVFFVIQFASGIAHSTGWPAVMEVMGSWITTNQSGLLLGIWSFHKLLGGVLGNLLSDSLVRYDWSLAFFVPATIMLITSFIVYSFLVPHPDYIGIHLVDTRDDVYANECTQLLEKDDQISGISRHDATNSASHTAVAITCHDAWTTQGIIEFALCMFFVKCVVFIFTYWLPHIIDKLGHSPTQAAHISTLFDVGCGVGGIVAGFIYDALDVPAIISCGFLFVSAPTFLCCSISTHIYVVLVSVFLCGCLVGGPVVIMTTSLAQRIASRDVRSIAMVTAILDGVGSLGASLGPFVITIFESVTNLRGSVWGLVIGYCVTGAMVLLRQCCAEFCKVMSVRKKGEKNQDENKTVSRN